MKGNAEFRGLEMPDRSNRYRNEAGEIVFREQQAQEDTQACEEQQSEQENVSSI